MRRMSFVHPQVWCRIRVGPDAHVGGSRRQGEKPFLREDRMGFGVRMEGLLESKSGETEQGAYDA